MKKFQRLIDNCQAEIEIEKLIIQGIESDIETKTKQLQEKMIPHKERIVTLEEAINDLQQIQTDDDEKEPM
jgi:hypothetical protein